jgi:hypothetical protein
MAAPTPQAGGDTMHIIALIAVIALIVVIVGNLASQRVRGRVARTEAA